MLGMPNSGHDCDRIMVPDYFTKDELFRLFKEDQILVVKDNQNNEVIYILRANRYIKVVVESAGSTYRVRVPS
jgi:hypothetical protein